MPFFFGGNREHTPLMHGKFLRSMKINEMMFIPCKILREISMAKVQTRLVSKVNVLSLLAWFLEASCVLQFVLTNSHDSKVSSTESSGNLRKTYSNRGDQIHDLPKPPEVQATPHFGATRNDHVNCNSCRHPTCQLPTSPHSSWH
jgi:hypothetical protein